MDIVCIWNPDVVTVCTLLSFPDVPQTGLTLSFWDGLLLRDFD